VNVIDKRKKIKRKSNNFVKRTDIINVKQ